MECSRAEKRLEAIARHLLLHRHGEPTQLFQPVLLSSEKLGNGGDSEPVIIGGMVMDLHVTSSIPTIRGSTVPGEVDLVPGGVARNVAECVSKLGPKPYMISALGPDTWGNQLLEYWESAKLSTAGIRKHQDIKTAVVCNVFDVTGEVAVGVARVDAVEKFLTPEWIQQFKSTISLAPIMMVDANLSVPALEASCLMAADSNTPVWFEPVSVAKSKRIASFAKHVTFVSPNEDELIAMANALSCGVALHPIKKDNSRTVESLIELLKPAVWVLLENGVRVVLVTLGSSGVFICCKGGSSFLRTSLARTKSNGFGGQLHTILASDFPSNQLSGTVHTSEQSHIFALHYPALSASIVRLTGAGDCLVGGVLASICAGLNIMQSVAVGIASSKAAVEAETNVPSAFSLASIADDAKMVYSSARVIFNQSMK